MSENKLTRTLIGKANSFADQRACQFHVHDENNDVREGDIVEISETRPISRTKSWTVSKIVERAEI